MKGKHLVLVLTMVALPMAVSAQVAVSSDCGGGLNLTPPGVSTIDADGGGSTFGVSADSGCWWAPTGITFDAETSEPWIDITSYGWSAGAGTVGFEVEANDRPGPRDGYIHVGGIATRTVHQLGNCGIIVEHAPAAGQLFVTNTACERVVEILDTSDRDVYPTSYPPNPVIAGEGIEYGPDGMLYVADPARGVYQIDPTNGSQQTEVGAAYHPTALRFTHRGDLIVLDGTNLDIHLFPNMKGVGGELSFGGPQTYNGPANVTALSDVTTAANGDLLVAGTDTEGGKVWRYPFLSATESYGPPEVAASGRTSPRGIARTARDDIIVGDGSQLWKYTDGTGTACGPVLGGTIFNVEPSADDTLYVTVQDSATQATLHEIAFDTEHSACASTQTTIATFTTANNPDAIPPLFGVAIANTETSGKLVTKAVPGLPEDSQLFTFFDSLYEFRAIDNPQCEVTVSAEEFRPSDVKDLIATLPHDVTSARPITFWGDNGRALGYHYNEVGTSCTGNEIESTLYEHAIDAYYSGFNPQIMRCDLEEGQPPACTLITFKSYFPGYGFFPDDGRIGGFDPRFSTSFLIDLADENTHYAGAFCGFQSPLDNDVTSPGDAAAPVFNGGSDMPVKFTVALRDADGSFDCQNGPFVTKGLIAVMSLARVKPDFAPIDNVDITGGGSFETDRIVFADPQNKNKPFALQIKLSAEGENLLPGTYQVVVTDDTLNTLYFPAQKTYFVVK